ncbi:MAG TPA: hypothetical protein VHZ55_11390 [Bryobacteraceae bacterium]|nr:hypothetical protein [Bryobacteraceae bacterium]
MWLLPRGDLQTERQYGWRLRKKELPPEALIGLQQRLAAWRCAAPSAGASLAKQLYDVSEPGLYRALAPDGLVKAAPGRLRLSTVNRYLRQYVRTESPLSPSVSPDTSARPLICCVATSIVSRSSSEPANTT